MSTPSIAAGQVLGHYRLIEKIGGGGQGEVYRAHDERFDRDVAVKILPFKLLPDEAARKRFRKEAQAVGKLTHPNIATAYYFGEESGVDFLVTEYVAGVGLDDKLARGAIPEETVVKLGIQLASGLEAAHREGIVHRDLKPGNLRITHDGHLKILDFGLAELLGPTGDVSSAQTVTVNMTLTGTIPYMAPEQFGGICDQRTDLWAAGAVLYEMATGQLPFPETQIQELRDAIQRKDPLPPRQVNPSISEGLEQVILRCLRKNPNQRYQSATALHEDLRRLAVGRKTKEHEKQQARRFAVGALVAVLLVSAITVAYYWPEIRQRLWPTSVEKAEQFRLMAILPLETGTQNPSDDALVRGVAETVSARIAQETNSQQLQLIPPSELIARSAKTSDAARREFGVERVLEVALQRSGDQVRITCSLIDSKTHKLVKACSVTGNGSNLFALQDELAGNVIAMLPPAFRNEQAAPSEVLAAAPVGYEFYLKGRGYLLDYRKPGNIDAAIREFEHALKVSPNYALAYAGLGEAYWRGYDFDRGKQWLDLASTNCEKALKIDSRLAEAHTCLGNIYNDTGHYEEAVDEFNRALAIDKPIPQTLNGLGKAYTKLGKTSEAEEAYKKAVTIWPQYWAGYNWLGRFYYNQAKYADAASMFLRVVELEPDNYEGYSNLSAMLLLQGKYNEAIDAASHSIKLSPALDAYSNLGAAYFWQHRYSDAIPQFEKARDLDDQDALNWGNLGDALYWSKGRRPEAAAAYKRAIDLARAHVQLNPRDATSRAYIAEYSAMIGDKTTAMAEIQRALQLAPADPEVMFRAGLVYNQLGDRLQTIDWLRKAVAAKYSLNVIRDTPDFANLQSDPDFKALLLSKQ